jgi:hypothetical protein
LMVGSVGFFTLSEVSRSTEYLNVAAKLHEVRYISYGKVASQSLSLHFTLALVSASPHYRPLEHHESKHGSTHYPICASSLLTPSRI